MKQFSAVVTDIRLQSRAGLTAVWEMTLDPTAFRPGNTGRLEAVTRTGTRLSIDIIAVKVDSEGNTWHRVEKPLAAGTEVTAHVA